MTAHLADAARDNPTGNAAARDVAGVSAETARTLVDIAARQVTAWSAAHERRTDEQSSRPVDEDF